MTLQVYEVGVVLGYQCEHGGAAGTCQGPWGELVPETGLGSALGPQLGAALHTMGHIEQRRAAASGNRKPRVFFLFISTTVCISSIAAN